MARATQDEKPRHHRHALTTLRHRDFRYIWTGQLVSTIGDQMQLVAISWHLLQLTNSTLRVGLVGVFGLAPFLVLSLAGGAVADRFDRRRVLMCTQSTMMALSLVLVFTTMTGAVTPTLIYTVAFISGFTRAFDGPARQALIPNLVPPEELASALTLNTMFRQMATIVGPGLGGLVVGFVGLSATYALNAASFLAIIGAVIAMRPLPRPATQKGSNWQLALGGLRFVRSEPVVLSVLTLDFLITGLGSIRSLLPVFARDILEIGPSGYGILAAAPAAGAVVGALILGAIGGGGRRPAIILGTSAVFGLCTIGFGVSRFLPLSLIFLFGTGLMDVIGEVMRSTIVQLRTPDEVRGRVTALSLVFSTGGPQMGQLTSGAMGTVFGPAHAAMMAGGAVLLAVAAYSFNRHIRVETVGLQTQTQIAPT